MAASAAPVPKNVPPITSVNQCTPSARRLYATRVAAPIARAAHKTRAIRLLIFGINTKRSTVARANTAVVWPLGYDPPIAGISPSSGRLSSKKDFNTSLNAPATPIPRSHTTASSKRRLKKSAAHTRSETRAIVEKLPKLVATSVNENHRDVAGSSKVLWIAVFIPPRNPLYPAAKKPNKRAMPTQTIPTCMFLRAKVSITPLYPVNEAEKKRHPEVGMSCVNSFAVACLLARFVRGYFQTPRLRR